MRKDIEPKVQKTIRHNKCSEIKKQMSILKEELTVFQKDCNHSEKMLKFGKSNNVFKYCITCYKKIGYPNETELRDNGFK
jgi:DNA-binding transcriptional regulator GbsR (MarR family)|tara:strand:+ start:21604 stop:21843 length:240 start_codon:yes stop_codon:yes gene_type:complete